MNVLANELPFGALIKRSLDWSELDLFLVWGEPRPKQTSTELKNPAVSKTLKTFVWIVFYEPLNLHIFIECFNLHRSPHWELKMWSVCIQTDREICLSDIKVKWYEYKFSNLSKSSFFLLFCYHAFLICSLVLWSEQLYKFYWWTFGTFF